MALRQTMVFHGTKGFIEINAPFNSNIYEGSEVRLHNVNHSECKTYNFANINQYTYQADAFALTVKQAMSKAKKDTAKQTKKVTRKKGAAQEIFSLENSMLNQRVIDAIYASGKNKGNWRNVL